MACNLRMMENIDKEDIRTAADGADATDKSNAEVSGCDKKSGSAADAPCAEARKGEEDNAKPGTEGSARRCSKTEGVKGSDVDDMADDEAENGWDDTGHTVSGGLFARMRAALRQNARRRRRELSRRLEYERLRRIRRRSVPAYTHCKNCGEPLMGMYCYRCGQYALDIEQPFWKYVKQYFENVYQFDSKVWRTLWLLVRRPGFLTQEFNAGKINSYVHPLRLFMFLSVLFFTFVFFFVPDAKSIYGELDDAGLTEMASLADLRDSTVQDPLRTVAHDIGLDEREQVWVASAREVFEGLDSLVTIHDVAGRDTLLVDVPSLLLDENLLVALPGDTVYWSRTDADCPPEALQTHETRRLRNEMMYSEFVGWISKWLPIVVLLLIPVFALLLQWFFRRRRLRYMAHFVMALHVHSVLLLLITAAIVAGVWCSVPAKHAFLIPALLFQLYMIASFHRLYGYGWVRTAVKSLVMYGVYLFIVFGVMVSMVVMAAMSLDVL